MEIRDIPVKAMTDAEVRETIAKMGGEGEYKKKLRNEYDHDPLPQPVAKSTQEILTDGFSTIAKLQGLSLPEYFQKNPKDYELVRQAGYSKNDY